MNVPLSTRTFIVSMAVIFLAALGFFCALYFYTNQAYLLNTNSDYLPVTTAPASLTLKIASPDDNILVFEEDLLLQGEISNQAVLLLLFNNQEQIIDAPSGYFSQTLKLVEGLNRLKLVAFDLSGNSKVEERTVYYSKEQI